MMAWVKLFAVFFRIGLFSFGGGYAMLPLIYQGILQFGLMDQAEFSNLVALSQVTPGPIAINAATYVGYQYAGFPGALAATLGVVAPSCILAAVALRFLARFRESQLLIGIMSGIQPATIGLLLAAAIFLSEQSFLLNGNVSVAAIGLAVAAGVIYQRFKVSPIVLTLIAGAAGAVLIR